tara:strand:- start:292 stop:924 length:633 start_codon:yes stop_codon:yes gene_type:complete
MKKVITLCSLLLATPVFADNKTSTQPISISDTKKSSKKERKYERWIKKCKRFSRRKKSCILVDKKARQMELYQNGKKTANYIIELGYNPIGDKTKEGDGRTPEGYYKLKFVNTWSSYHKGLRVGYPNGSDWREFYRLKNKGELSSSDTIGSEIEIHGDGSTTTKSDWTIGCMALSNKDIDNLYRKLRISNRRMKPKRLKDIRVAIVPYRK